MSIQENIKPIITPVGDALWAKITEATPSKFNPTPMYSMDIVYDPAEIAEFKAQVNQLLDEYYDEVHAGLNAAKQKTLAKADPFKDHTDRDGNLTGNVVIKTKQYGQNMKGEPVKLAIADASGAVIKNFKTLVANGSKVRAKVFPKLYHMGSTNQVGVSFRLNAVQIVELIEYQAKNDGFDAVDGYKAPETEDKTGFEDDLDF